MNTTFNQHLLFFTTGHLGLFFSVNAPLTIACELSADIEVLELSANIEVCQ